MKSNITETPLKTYPSIPKYWKSRLNTVNYDTLPPAEHYKDGWRDYLAPVYDPATHRIGELIYDKEKEVVTREVVKLTAEELEQIRKAQIPASITPTQGRVLLAQMPGSKEGESLLHDVLALIPEDKTDPVFIYFEYAISWDRESQFVGQLAAALGLTDDAVDALFVAASQISN